MAYRGDFYYDEFDYDDYQESLDYDAHDEPSPEFGDVLSCGIAVSKQISIQLLSLLLVNFLYRLVRQSSEWLIYFHQRHNRAVFLTDVQSFRYPRLHEAIVFFFARLFLHIHLLHDRQLFRLPSRLRLVRVSETPTTNGRETTRISRHWISNRFALYLVRNLWLQNYEVALTDKLQTLFKWNLGIRQQQLAACTRICSHHIDEGDLVGFWH